MSRRFAARGDSQTDFEFLRKDYENSSIDPREDQSEFISTEETIDSRDNQSEFISSEPEDLRNEQDEFDMGLDDDNPFILSIEKAYADRGVDFSSEVMSWIVQGATTEDVRSHVMNDVGINISLAESAAIVDSLSKVLEATSIKNRKIIPLKSASMDSFIRTASAQFKCKFANVYWKVKAIKDESGKEDFYLVRIED